MALIKLKQALPGLSKVEEINLYFDRLGRACYFSKNYGFIFETIPRREYNIRDVCETFMEDLLWSMYLHRKLQKSGTFLEDV